MDNNDSIPWVEKYRPKVFSDIVLNDNNKALLENILKNDYFPNLLLYGPPGTGKTTTIINLINKYQELNNEKSKELIVHLNASDDRGIDIIRNQINQFVNSKTLFTKGLKFIILDEVDYMTKNAQIAMKNLLQKYQHNVRFFLICNYISRIDNSLQNEFIRLRFNNLPKNKTVSFLQNITKQEQLNIPKEKLEKIQELFKSDIRSMINYIQSNQHNINNNNIINSKIFLEITNKFKKNTYKNEVNSFIYELSILYSISPKNIIINYFNYIIQQQTNYVTSELLYFIENIIHSDDIDVNYLIIYFIEYMYNFYAK